MSELTHERVVERLVEAKWRWSRVRMVGGEVVGDYWKRPKDSPVNKKKQQYPTIFVPTNRAFADYEQRLHEAALESGLWEMRLCQVVQEAEAVPAGLTRREWAALEVLRAHPGEYLTGRDIVRLANGWEDTESMVLGRMYVWKLRQKGYEIACRRGFGYRLVGEPQ